MGSAHECDAEGAEAVARINTSTEGEDEDCATMETILHVVPPEYMESLGSKDTAKQAVTPLVLSMQLAYH
jgi:hypothetical protein